MPRKKRRIRRRIRRAFRARYPKRKSKMSIAVTAGFLGGLALGKPSEGWKSPVEAAQAGDWDGVGRAVLGNLTGINLHKDVGLKFEWMRVLNPFDFGRAPALKGAIWGMVAHWIAQRFGINRYLERTPKIGKYLRI